VSIFFRTGGPMWYSGAAAFPPATSSGGEAPTTSWYTPASGSYGAPMSGFMAPAASSPYMNSFQQTLPTTFMGSQGSDVMSSPPFGSSMGFGSPFGASLGQQPAYTPSFMGSTTFSSTHPAPGFTIPAAVPRTSSFPQTSPPPAGYPGAVFGSYTPSKPPSEHRYDAWDQTSTDLMVRTQSALDSQLQEELRRLEAQRHLPQQPQQQQPEVRQRDPQPPSFGAWGQHLPQKPKEVLSEDERILRAVQEAEGYRQAVHQKALASAKASQAARDAEIATLLRSHGLTPPQPTSSPASPIQNPAATNGPGSAFLNGSAPAGSTGGGFEVVTRDASPSYDSDDEDKMVGMRLPKGAMFVFETIEDPSLPVSPTQPAPPMKERVGLDDFELIKVLGKGAFGKVWKVRRKSHSDFYAMKVMSKRHFWKQNLVELLKAEKATMAKIKHPFIVGLRWAWQTLDRAFLVMDYMPGGELSALLRESPGGRFDEARARFYTAQIALALEYLHSMNIMYRDIKPDNIVLDQEGNAMLIDFGLAKPLPPFSKDGGANYFGQPNYYLSPEMVKGEPFGLEVDWWMLGVFVYQMLVGTFPWTGRNPREVHTQVISPTPVVTPPGICSSEASDFITRVLWKDRKQRLRTAAQVKSHQWLAGVPWDPLLRKHLCPVLGIEEVGLALMVSCLGCPAIAW
jgi:hypothetical protein